MLHQHAQQLNAFNASASDITRNGIATSAASAAASVAAATAAAAASLSGANILQKHSINSLLEQQDLIDRSVAANASANSHTHSKLLANNATASADAMDSECRVPRTLVRHITLVCGSICLLAAV